MTVISWVSVLIVFAIVVAVVVSIAVALATSSKGSRPLMWGLLGTLFAVLVVGAAVLVLKPSRATLTITAPAGTGFAGKVVVDGVEQRIAGVVPAEVEFVGRRIEYVIIPVTVDQAAPLRVEVAGSGSRSKHGAQGTVTAMPGGFQHASHAVSEADWQRSSAELLPTAAEQDAAPAPESAAPAVP